MAEIFINYRWQISPETARALLLELQKQFGDKVFLDATAILAGEHIERVIRQRLSKCRVLLVLIGDDWSDVRADGQRRLDDPRDPVRLEIAEALSIGLYVIPVLLDGAEMPKLDRLPTDIQLLADCRGTHLRHESWDADLAALTAELRRHVKPKRSTPGLVSAFRVVVETIGLARRAILGTLLLTLLAVLARVTVWAETPDLVGLPRKAAELMLEARLINHETVDAGVKAAGLAPRVVDQQPRPGALATRVGGVKLVVAPGNPEQGQAAEISDEELRHALVGKWRQIRPFNGWIVDQVTAISADGSSWTKGVATLLGISLEYRLRGTWTVGDTTIKTRVEYSSVPGAAPVGFESVDDIIAVDADEMMLHSRMDDQVYVDLRVK